MGRNGVKYSGRNQKEVAEISELNQRIKIECYNGGVKEACSQKPRGTKLYSSSESDIKTEKSTSSSPKTGTSSGHHPEGPVSSLLTDSLFEDLPLSKNTLEGLKASGFFKLTQIQKLAIPHALAGRDILGEAKTGSGKTLAFIVPVLENLYRKRWSSEEGLAALVITPTRELAAQIFDVCGKAGRKHDFSAGCIIGGKDVKIEQSRINQLNILVATPGRLEQHMQESPLWDASNLQILVVDEVDRMFDMGFVSVMKRILADLPAEKQSLFFSATLRSAVRTLARITLKSSPVHLTVDAESPSRTPGSLKQLCVVVPLQEKYNTLFGFLRTHGSMKILVFVSSCKQVRFLHDAFQQLKLGCSIMEVHGRQCQQKRLAVFEAFKRSSGHVALISTDLASRGIDFPTVDWVVQVDCPDCVDTYIHRVGRTARFEKGGNALLLLLPSEVAFLKRLKEKKIDVTRISLNPKKATQLKPKLETMLAKQEPLLYLAQRSLVSYVRCVSMMRDKNVFDVSALPLAEFADAIGLPETPVLTINMETAQEDTGAADSECSDGEVVTGNCVVKEEKQTKRKNRTKLDKLKEKIRASKMQKRLREDAS